MTSEQLRQQQAPFKAKYKDQPESALYTLHAQARLGTDVQCEVEASSRTITAGLHPATGGDGHTVCSADMLLQALAACAGVTMNSVATVMDFQWQSIRILAEGDMDFRGTLGTDRTAPVGFKAIRLRFEMDSDESDERKANLLRLTERYCVVLQTLTQGVPITSVVS